MRICKLVFGLVITSALVWGQAASTAQLNGVVRDSSGLAVPGAEVKATQTATRSRMYFARRELRKLIRDDAELRDLAEGLLGTTPEGEA